MRGNLRSGLRLRRRSDPMRAYDALPAPLRQWMAQAALPWSPASCRRIWVRAQQRGEPVETVLARLDRAEEITLSRDKAALALSPAPEGGSNALQ